MSASGGEGSGPLQFEHADLVEPAPLGLACAECQRTLIDAYYAVEARTLCERCQTILRYDHEHGRGTRWGRFTRACAFGALAALAGTLLWYAVRKLTGYEVGLIAVVVGVAVGSAVRAGSHGRGGWRYQTLAIFLTYASIVSNYIPDIVTEMTKAAGQPRQAQAHDPVASAPAPPPAPDGGASLLGVAVALAFLMALVFVAPFLGGFENIIGILIIGIALYEAWKLNRRVPLQIGGPYRVGAAAPAPE